MDQIVLSDNGYFFLLQCIPCAEPLLVLPHTVTKENRAEQFLKAREDWTEQGLAELDFDGGLNPSMALARMLYVISHRGSIFRWEHDGEVECWVRGPADFLRIYKAQGQVMLEQRKYSDLLTYGRDVIVKNPGGSLASKNEDDDRTLSKEGEKSWADRLIEHLTLTYWRPENA